MRETKKRGAGWTAPALAILTLSSGCANLAPSATDATICRELRQDLPTYSQADTPKTIEEGARFLTVFQAACDGAL